MADDEREYLSFLPLFAESSEEDVLARLIDWANEGLTPDSDRWVDTRELGLWRTLAIPVVREMARLYDVLGVDVPASASPLRSWGPYLDEHAEVVDLQRLAATYATGSVRFTGPAGTVVSAGTQVGVVPTSEDSPAPAFEVAVEGAIPPVLTPPTGLTATPSTTGGTLPAGTHYYIVTALSVAGETLGSTEVSAVTTGATSSVALDWAANPNAISFRVYRGPGTGAQNTYYTALTDAFTDTGGAGTAGTPPTVSTAGNWIDLTISALLKGTDGNVAANAIEELLTPLAGVTVNNALPTTGGTEPETDQALRRRLLEAYRGQGAGNPGDYRRVVGEIDGVGRVTVIRVWDGPGTVKVVIGDPDGQPVSAQKVAEVQNFLDPTAGGAEGWAPIGIAVTVETPTTLNIAITANIEPEIGYSVAGGTGTTALQASLVAAVNAYLKTIEAGGEVVRSAVQARLQGVSGVHDVGSVTLAGTSANVAVPSDPAKVPIATVQTYTEAVL